ncbi:MAG TPA: UxaA family hydrolase [Casimicrobiaceae bacterium]|jgi:altronate dehydratase
MKWHATALAAADNVAVVLQPVAAGDTVLVKGAEGMREVRATEAIALCHKIALADIAPGDAVVKYGECIGEASAPIARGSWVHVHNVRSRRARV